MAAATQRTWLDRALCPCSDVRGGEGRTAVLLAGNLFFVMTAHAVLKVTRGAVILGHSGAEIRSYSIAAQAVLLIFLVPLYGYAAERLDRIKLVRWSVLVLISHLVIFSWFGAAGLGDGVFFYLWAGIFNVLVVSQFWSIANDIYNVESGARLFPVVGVGGSLGAWAGSAVAAPLYSDLGAEWMMLTAAGLLALSLPLNFWASRSGALAREPVRAGAGSESGTGLEMIIGQRNLAWIALLAIVWNATATTADFVFARILLENARVKGGDVEREVATVYARLLYNAGLLTILSQAFLVSRWIRRFGVASSLGVLPSVSAAAHLVLAVHPEFAIARTARLVSDALSYSLQNTAWHALFLPASRPVKYKAKIGIDTLAWRIGDLLHAGLVWLGLRAGLDASQFAALTSLLAIAWLVVTVRVKRQRPGPEQ